MVRDFPGGPVVKNPPSNAGGMQVQSLVGELRSHMPGATKPVPQLLSSRASTREPACRKLEHTCPEAHAPQLERENLHATLERSPRTTTKSPHAATKTQHSQKNKLNK